MPSARRYLAVVQAPEGYPPRDAPMEDAPSVPQPIIYGVVLETEYDRLREALDALVRSVASMPDAGLSDGDPRRAWWFDVAAPALRVAREALDA